MKESVQDLQNSVIHSLLLSRWPQIFSMVGKLLELRVKQPAEKINSENGNGQAERERLTFNLLQHIECSNQYANTVVAITMEGSIALEKRSE